VVQRLERLRDLDGGGGHAGVEERRGRLQEQNRLLRNTRRTLQRRGIKSEAAREG
jgi:hypothetical protein